MISIKKGDIVGRKSYNKDILFIVDRILRTTNNKAFVNLKGLMVRIEADAPVEDLEIIDKKEIYSRMQSKEKEFLHRMEKFNRSLDDRIIAKMRTGKILHVDGDKKYSDKSINYYKRLNLNAIVKNIPENRQTQMITPLLKKYKPDILVITGHDAMLKNDTNYNNIYNYRNSKYFINTVKEARKWEPSLNKLVIFAGACQSFFEAIMQAGANFASSPGRILIDFIDPIVIAEKVATTEENKFINIREVINEIKEGMKGIGGVGAIGKMKCNIHDTVL